MLYIYIGFILLASFIAHKIYKLFEIPEHLKSVPQISFINIIISLIKGEPFDVRYEKVFQSAMEKSKYGIVWQQGKWEVIVCDGLSIKHIFNHTDIFLKKKDHVFKKNQLGRKFFGISNIISNDNEEWKRHRRIINPAFKKSWSVELFSDSSNDLIEKIRENGNKPVMIHDLFQRFTLDVLGKGLFSFDFEAVKNNGKGKMITVYNEILKGLFNPIYFIFPILESIVPSRQYYRYKIDEFRSFLADIIALRAKEIESGNSKDDLVSLMLNNMMGSTKDSLTIDEVVNNLTAFFLAGHDTTANTLTSAVYFLAKYPEIQEKAHKELINILGNSGNCIPSHEQQKSLVYLNCFIKETMRSITTVSSLKRYCVKDEILPNGVLVKKGTYVTCHLWGLHHASKYFPDPEKFDPDRFLDPHSDQINSWMPFSYGSRLCIGINFSLIEQRVVLSLLLQKYQIKLGQNSKQWEKPLLTTAGFILPKDLDIQFISRVDII